MQGQETCERHLQSKMYILRTCQWLFLHVSGCLHFPMQYRFAAMSTCSCAYNAWMKDLQNEATCQDGI